MKVTAIILAAGRGTRMGTEVPKQFLDAGGVPLLAKSLAVFESSPKIDEIVIVTNEEYIGYVRAEIAERLRFHKVAAVVAGGAERYDSVWNGLMAAHDCDYILIHDGARPFVTEDIIERTVEGAVNFDAAACGMPSKDTVKIVDKNNFVKMTPERSSVWNIQTPQGFKYDLLVKANEIVRKTGMQGVTDDAMIVEASGLSRVKLVEGSYENIKITSPDDLKWLA